MRRRGGWQDQPDVPRRSDVLGRKDAAIVRSGRKYCADEDDRDYGTPPPSTPHAVRREQGRPRRVARRGAAARARAGREGETLRRGDRFGLGRDRRVRRVVFRGNEQGRSEGGVARRIVVGTVVARRFHCGDCRVSLVLVHPTKTERGASETRGGRGEGILFEEVGEWE